MNAIEIYESAKKEANADRLGDHSNSCVCCGLRTAEKLYIHATTDWTAVDVETIPEDEDFDSQGFFPVGPECAKRFPNGYIFDAEFKQVQVKKVPKPILRRTPIFTIDQRNRILAARIELSVQAGECIEWYLSHLRTGMDNFDYIKMLKTVKDSREFGFEI
jgi:hypothetical protein